MTRLLGLMAVLLLLALPAHAASFDCSKAATGFETAICATPETSQEDEILAQAYATALGGLSKPAAAELTATQKSWLNYAERICSDDAEPIAGAYTEDQQQCLASTFRNRIRDLEASRMQGGYRFYPVDRYLVQQDIEAEPDAYNKVADKAYHTVKIDRDDEAAASFNAAIDAMMADQGNFFEPGTTIIAADDPTSDYEVSTKVTEVSVRRISLQTDEYWYGHGAAHGNYFITNRHFLLDRKRLLEASDIFVGDEWQAKIGALAAEKVKAQLGDDFFETSADDITRIATDPLRWDFTDAGLTIQFNIYEVTAYAMGAPLVTIPWDEIDALLTEDARIIAGAY